VEGKARQRLTSPPHGGLSDSTTGTTHHRSRGRAAVRVLLRADASHTHQNWLLTIVHRDYLGFTYAAYLGLIFLFYRDVWFNEGRISARILRLFIGI
jgi:hypothetical protein